MTDPKERRKKYLIVGCGYVGRSLAQQLLKDGAEVYGWVRSEQSALILKEEGIRPIIGNASEAAAWKKIDFSFDVVVHCASSGRGGVESYREVYFQGLEQVVRHQPAARKIFVSSTSVYGQNEGEEVTENSLTAPVSETGKILRESEELGMKSGVVIARAAGIYGPTRHVLLDKLKRGEAVIEGDGRRWINQIHRDDVAGGILKLIEKGAPGEIYNLADNKPAQYLSFFEWLCAQLKLPMPPFAPVNLQRKRGVTNKRILNAKLRQLGWAAQYPDFRSGYSRIIAEDEKF